MAQELINIGVTADDGTGDTIRGAGIKINNNFTELYATGSGSSQLTFIQNNISATDSNSDISLGGNGTGVVRFSDLTIDHTIRMSDNRIRTNTSNADLVITASGTGKIQTSVSGERRQHRRHGDRCFNARGRDILDRELQQLRPGDRRCDRSG